MEPRFFFSSFFSFIFLILFIFFLSNSSPQSNLCKKWKDEHDCYIVSTNLTRKSSMSPSVNVGLIGISLVLLIVSIHFSIFVELLCTYDVKPQHDMDVCVIIKYEHHGDGFSLSIINNIALLCDVHLFLGFEDITMGYTNLAPGYFIFMLSCKYPMLIFPRSTRDHAVSSFVALDA